MSAESVAIALRGKRVGNCWMARCPCHADSTPSLAIEDKAGKVVIFCHAGCSQSDVVRALRTRGIWPPAAPERREAHQSLRADGNDDRSAKALAHWKSALPGDGRLVETYLKSRGIFLPVPDALRFRLRMYYPGFAWLPAMVALIVNAQTGAPQAIHRTFLAQDGRGKARVPSPKKMLGPCAGGVVKLAAVAPTLIVGEGIETTLAAMQRFRLPGWATLSAPGLAKFRVPESVEKLVIAADGDAAGRRAAASCARRAQGAGVRVWIAAAPDGQDWNDVAMQSNDGAA